MVMLFNNYFNMSALGKTVRKRKNKLEIMFIYGYIDWLMESKK